MGAEKLIVLCACYCFAFCVLRFAFCFYGKRAQRPLDQLDRGTFVDEFAAGLRDVTNDVGDALSRNCFLLLLRTRRISKSVFFLAIERGKTTAMTMTRTDDNDEDGRRG